MSLIGALGKISLNSTKNPKQTITFQTNVSNTIDPAKAQVILDHKLSSKSILCLVEKVYDLILEIESYNRARSYDKDAQKEDELKLHSELWNLIQCDEFISYSTQHPAPMLLQSSKGKLLIPRLIKVLSDEQTTKLFLIILNRLECLDVCHVKLGQLNENV